MIAVARPPANSHICIDQVCKRGTDIFDVDHTR